MNEEYLAQRLMWVYEMSYDNAKKIVVDLSKNGLLECLAIKLEKDASQDYYGREYK